MRQYYAGMGKQFCMNCTGKKVDGLYVMGVYHERNGNGSATAGYNVGGASELLEWDDEL